MAVSRIPSWRPRASALEDQADVDAADVGRVIVEQAQEARFRIERRIDLLAPLSLEAPDNSAVAGIDVAADTDRPTVVEARVGSGPAALHQEVARAVPDDEIRDHLLPARV